MSSTRIRIMKLTLMSFNFIIWILGCVITLIGLWVHYKGFKYLDIDPDTNQIFSPYMGIYTIVIGMTLALIGLLACCCTFTGNTICLYLFAAFMSVMLVLELSLAMTAFAYRGKLKDIFRNSLKNSMQTYDVYLDSKEAVDDIHSTLHCCGIESYEDWQQLFHKPVPDSCCKMTNCNTDITMNINKPGCYSTFVNFVSTSSQLIALIGLAVGCFQMLGIMMTCCLAHVINRVKYELID